MDDITQAYGLTGYNNSQVSEDNGSQTIGTVDPNDPNYATNIAATIARGEWNRYKSTFMPLEDYLISTVGNPGYYNTQVGNAVNSFTSGMNSANQGYARNLHRYGLMLNNDEQQSFNRQKDQAMATGTVNAINQTRNQLQNQEAGILGTSSYAPSNATLQQANVRT